MTTHRYEPNLFETFLVPLAFLPFLAWYLADSHGYIMAMQEDTPVEWATFVLLVVSGMFAGATTWRLKGAGVRATWFLWGFTLGMFIAALEEISFGQRVFGFVSPDWFLEHSDQQEVNAHNLLQQSTGIMTRSVTGLALFVYGVVLPLAARRRAVAELLERWGVIVPPVSLAPSFAIGSILMIDRPTGEEEELGELLHAACLALLASGWWRTARRNLT